jgi:hypothetical protein
MKSIPAVQVAALLDAIQIGLGLSLHKNTAVMSPAFCGRPKPV